MSNTYAVALTKAILSAYAGNQDAVIAAARSAMLNADTFTADDLKTHADILKAKGTDSAIVSKWYGKGGIVKMAQENPDMARTYLDANPKITSVQTLYREFKAAVKGVNSDKLDVSNLDPEDAADQMSAAANVKAAKEAEAAGKSVSKALPKLSTQQLVGALLTHAASLTKPADRLAFYAAISEAMADAREALERDLRKLETAPV